jgi:hypothetical protein
MYILNQGNKYSCKNYINTSKYVIFEGIEEPIEHFTGVITLCQDDGFILAEEDVSKYAKQTFVNCILTLTNEPEPEPQSDPPSNPPTTVDMAEMLLDLEFRTSLLEMGVK